MPYSIVHRRTPTESTKYAFFSAAYAIDGLYGEYVMKVWRWLQRMVWWAMIKAEKSRHCYKEGSNPTSLHEPPCDIYFILDNANFKTFRNTTEVETEIIIVGTTSHRTTNLVRYRIIWMVHVNTVS